MRGISKPEGKEAFSILVVDDEPGIRDFLQRALSKIYGVVEVANSAEQAEELRHEYYFDLLIIDICLPGCSGVEWLKTIAQGDCQSDVIFMTAFSNLENAIEALRLGATDFILKPFRLEEMTASVERCMERRRLERENFVLRRQVDQIYSFEGMIGKSPKIQEMCQLIKRIAPTPSVVLVAGETGTGKELVANAIHQESGRTGPFVPINCGAVAPELLESEFFGHKKGAFTGASETREGLFSYAEAGTLFLDEIGEMPLTLQAKLLRVLEEKSIRPIGGEREMPINVRIIAATNLDLEEAVEKGEFRKDLFFRLNVLNIQIPPLRERKQDIVPLVEYYSSKLSKHLGVEAIPFSHSDIQIMEDYNWPGNVRELKNMVERCLLLGRLPVELFSMTELSTAEQQGYPDVWSLAEVEKDHIIKLIQKMDGNKSKAAQVLGISRKTLDRKLHAWEHDNENV